MALDPCCRANSPKKRQGVFAIVMFLLSVTFLTLGFIYLELAMSIPLIVYGCIGIPSYIIYFTAILRQGNYLHVQMFMPVPIIQLIIYLVLLFGYFAPYMNFEKYFSAFMGIVSQIYYIYMVWAYAKKLKNEEDVGPGICERSSEDYEAVA